MAARMGAAAEETEGNQTTGAPFRLNVTLLSSHTPVESETNFLPEKGARLLTPCASRAAGQCRAQETEQ